MIITALLYSLAAGSISVGIGWAFRHGSESKVAAPPFPVLCQRIAHSMIMAGKTWDEIDEVLRYEATRELMSKKKHTVDEFVEFYKINFQRVDALWLPAVLRMKQDYQRMTENPDAFLRELGMLPQTPLFNQRIADIVNRLPPKH